MVGAYVAGGLIFLLAYSVLVVKLARRSTQRDQPAVAVAPAPDPMPAAPEAGRCLLCNGPIGRRATREEIVSEVQRKIREETEELAATLEEPPRERISRRG